MLAQILLDSSRLRERQAMSKVSCNAAGKRRRRLCDWRVLNLYLPAEINRGNLPAKINRIKYSITPTRLNRQTYVAVMSPPAPQYPSAA